MQLIRKAEQDGFTYTTVQGDSSVDVTALCYDSRKVTEGCLFVCMCGSTFDSHQAIPDIVKKGARAIVIERDTELPDHVTVIRVGNSRKALAHLSAAWFDFPSRKMFTIGVTGTKGKTTTTHMIRALLEHAGKKTGMVGTNGIFIGSERIPTMNTTPESYQLQEAFRKMADAGCTAMVMEVSSQGIMLHRTDAIEFDIGIFTNISPDHIGPNEHKDFAEYLMCKTGLFSQCRKGLVNADDGHAESVLSHAECPEMMTFAADRPADFRMSGLTYISEGKFVGLAFQITPPAGGLLCHVGIPGRFNAFNALAALSAGELMGLDEETLQNGLRDIRVNGRMEVAYSGDFTVLIDYAHNAVSMDSLLDTLREYHPKRLVVVFGCGGNRSRDRRYSMGKIGGEKADLSIITADNSRFEKVEDIIADIRGSMEKTGGKFLEIPDRREAIFYAVQNALPGDMIAVIGKGHEDYQEINGVRHHFLDREVVEEALSEMKNKS